MGSLPMNPEALPKTRAVIQEGIDQGLHLGAQLYASLPGREPINLAMGQARPGVAMTPDILLIWMSSTKPVAAVAIAQLWERGLLQLDDPVARHIPEFAQNQKEAVTIRHLLTHTGGFRASPPWSNTSWEQIIERVCRLHLESGWMPGQKAGYHTASSWYILGEIVRRLDGRPYDQYVRQAIFEPLGMMDSWIGMPRQTYRDYAQRVGWMYLTQNGVVQEPTPQSQEDAAVICRPGGNGHGPMQDLGRFYEMLRDGGRGTNQMLLQPPTVQTLIAPHRRGMYDVTFDFFMDWGLGLILNTSRPGIDEMPYGFGPYASARAFGHGGHQSSQGMCDPRFGLVLTFAFNGQPGEDRHHQRRGATVRAVYEDLDLV